MPKGGRLTVATRSVVPDAETINRHSVSPVGPYVCLSVSDTGSGIDTAALEHLFEPFFTTKPLLNKPYNIATLATTVRSLFDKKS